MDFTLIDLGNVELLTLAFALILSRTPEPTSQKD